MINEAEAQELHELIGATLDVLRDRRQNGGSIGDREVEWLTRARELASVVLSDVTSDTGVDELRDRYITTLKEEGDDRQDG